MAKGEDRKRLALETCKAVGLVMDKLEERNEMSETVSLATLESAERVGAKGHGAD